MNELQVVRYYIETITLKLIMVNVIRGVVEILPTHVMLNLYIECTLGL